MTCEHPHCHTFPGPHLPILRAFLHSRQDVTFKHRGQVNFHISPNKCSFYWVLCYYRCTVILKHFNVLFCLNKNFQGEPTSYKASKNQLMEVWGYTKGHWGTPRVCRFCTVFLLEVEIQPMFLWSKLGLQQIAVSSAENNLLTSQSPWSSKHTVKLFFFFFQIHPPR